MALSKRIERSASFFALAALVALAGAAGWRGHVQHRDVQQRVAAVETLRDDVQLMRFHAADVTGWQALSVADTGAYGFSYLKDAEAYNRQGFADAKAEIYELLAATHTQHMTAAELEAFARIEPAWNTFFSWDDRLMQWLAADNQASRAKVMDSINGGEASDSYGDILHLTEDLEQSVASRATKLHSDAASVGAFSLTVLAALLGAAFVLALVMGLRFTLRADP
ncbi:hypothetical protein [Actinoplanes sp. NPDC051859]|uniref:hypothetical protein n=1 Tax=Actinoplanes sp. NPDC051859 TaxID=3363909 RepID=UPI0037A79636